MLWILHDKSYKNYSSFCMLKWEPCKNISHNCCTNWSVQKEQVSNSNNEIYFSELICYIKLAENFTVNTSFLDVPKSKISWPEIIPCSNDSQIVIKCYFHDLNLCTHVESTTLADGTYELVPASESEQREAQANLTEAFEDPSPSSEDPQANCEGKPRSITHSFRNYATHCSLLVH